MDLKLTVRQFRNPRASQITSTLNRAELAVTLWTNMFSTLNPSYVASAISGTGTSKPFSVTETMQ
jgi:hypothetical protein